MNVVESLYHLTSPRQNCEIVSSEVVLKIHDCHVGFCFLAFLLVDDSLMKESGSRKEMRKKRRASSCQ